jgi:amino acid adenylation domain-containing protein
LSAESVSAFRRIWSDARRDPDRIIVRDRHRAWCWRELLGTAAAYTEAIERACAVRDTRIVPIVTDRSGHTIAAILGVLLGGRAFAPLSAQQPATRIDKCLDALDASVVIQLDGLVPFGADTGVVTLPPAVVTAFAAVPAEPPAPGPDQLLYVLFTSGSTGTPKGVMVDWDNIENTMLWSVDMLEWRDDDVIGCAANLFFDIAMFDVFTSFYFSVPLSIYSAASVVETVLEETSTLGVTSVFCVPTFFSQLWRSGKLEDARLSTLRRIVSGGDFFPPAHILGWLHARPRTDIYNVWGPTETSIVNTMHRVDESDLPRLRSGQSPSVGRAHPRMPFALVDESGRVVDRADERGEICMLGRCVTRGYLADPDTTARSYVRIGDERAFRTQDLGYVDSEGELFILGRIGSTVKVAGYRVDLSEVEHAAVAVPGVHLACAFVQDAAEDIKELCLALAPDRNVTLDIFAVKQRLRTVLPAYMVPKRVVVWDDLPRNANGKIDRREVARKALA